MTLTSGDHLTLTCARHPAGAGRAPYGYRPSLRPDRAGLEPDPYTAPVVRRIFREYVSGSGLQSIAERLTACGIPRPSAYDPRRNPHHRGSAWSKQAVRAIITNSRYAGEHMALDHLEGCSGCGGLCTMQPTPPLIPPALYRDVQDILAQRGRGGSARGRAQAAEPPAEPPAEPVRAGSRYLLRGRLRCGLCERLMQGTRNNGAPYYRCRFPREYARANGLTHPVNVYVREDRVVEPLWQWLPRSLRSTVRESAARQPQRTVNRLLERVGRLRALMERAEADDVARAELLNALRLRLVYEDGDRTVRVSAEVLHGLPVHGVLTL
ncbi:recombinase family protein [Streptomyces sp. WMMC897]|uniref:recombinase family protein n=1 Tax=Streptomyces sp. WMMC897 TaxID=3014782 RepID=UPI0022B624C5|nr:recombinase family protein [Streptomyces sp. WMMC897]MCZ7414349.1 recombinase family protein [Streptomyces sp. WMMC897]